MKTVYSVLIVDDDPMVAMINEQYVCKNKQFKVADDEWFTVHDNIYKDENWGRLHK